MLFLSIQGLVSTTLAVRLLGPSFVRYFTNQPHMVIWFNLQLAIVLLQCELFFSFLFTGKHGWQRLLLLGVAGQHH